MAWFTELGAGSVTPGREQYSIRSLLICLFSLSLCFFFFSSFPFDLDRRKEKEGFPHLCKKSVLTAFLGELPTSPILLLCLSHQPKHSSHKRVLRFPGICLRVCLHLNLSLFCQQRENPFQETAGANCPLDPCSLFPTSTNRTQLSFP